MIVKVLTGVIIVLYIGAVLFVGAVFAYAAVTDMD